MLQATLKAKRCKECKGFFTPMRPMAVVCGLECSARYATKQSEKKRSKAAKEERARDREKREKLKTRSDYIKEAQREFNRYIRLRDAGKPCICCGDELGGSGVGGMFDAGHYRSVGSAPHLRFDERNCHGQTKKCNRYGSGRAVDYRIGLINRIGRAAVEELESDQAPKHYGIEDLKAIRDKYRGMSHLLLSKTAAESA